MTWAEFTSRIVVEESGKAFHWGQSGSHSPYRQALDPPPWLALPPHVPGTSNSSRPLLSAGSGWGNQVSWGWTRGSSGGGVGIRGGGRMCRSLDTSEGRVTSPPCTRERPAGGVTGDSLWAGTLPRCWGPGKSRRTYPEELLELGAVVERGDVHSEAKQVLGPLSPLLNHRGFKPACTRQDKGQGDNSDPRGLLASRPLFLVLPERIWAAPWPLPHSPRNPPWLCLGQGSRKEGPISLFIHLPDEY